MVHYDVQLIGGMVLHDGKIAEMQTGEGKTLVATLPAYLNGLSGLGVHIITVNDYLARRDSEWVGPIFQFLHLTVDCIDKYPPHSEKRISAYNSDICCLNPICSVTKSLAPCLCQQCISNRHVGVVCHMLCFG